jgi:predicted HAD superfamily Cof-like phosphohydrolase
MMRVFGQDTKTTPSMILDYKERLLAANLVHEEAEEFVESLGFKIVSDAEGSHLEVSGQKPDLVEAADAIGDVLVVIYGAANRLGVNAYDLFAEVMRSNMTKVWPDGTVHRRELDGKVIKPSTYSPANIRKLLNEAIISKSSAWVTEKFPFVKQSLSRGLDIWGAMATEACGETFKFSYQVTQNSSLMDNPLNKHVKACLDAVKFLATQEGKFDDPSELAEYIGSDLLTSVNIYRCLIRTFPGIAVNIDEPELANPNLNVDSFAQRENIISALPGWNGGR